MHWKNLFSKHSLPAVLREIYISPAAGQPMQLIREAMVSVGKGIEGDRYYFNNGYWQSVDACQVTLISASDLAVIEQQNSSLCDGNHRRNLVVSGIALKELQNKNFQLGEAIFSFHRLRPPCAYLDTISGCGAAKALRDRGGICLKVIQGGMIKVGDTLTCVN
jgi:MOSC domain-containing protein YiiM